MHWTTPILSWLYGQGGAHTGLSVKQRIWDMVSKLMGSGSMLLKIPVWSRIRDLKSIISGASYAEDIKTSLCCFCGYCPFGTLLFVRLYPFLLAWCSTFYLKNITLTMTTCQLLFLLELTNNKYKHSQEDLNKSSCFNLLKHRKKSLK